MTHRLTLLAALVLLSACSQSYTCGDFPDAVCQTVSENYNQSKDPGVSAGGTPGAPHGPGAVPLTSSDHLMTPPPAPDHALLDGPFLTRPRLLRVLLTPWEDKHRDLHTGGYLYLRLEDSKWVIPR